MIGWLLIAIALVEVWLGFWFLTKYQKNQATMWYGLFALAVAFYVGSNGFGYLSIGDPNITEKIGWSAGAALTACFLAFSFSFPLPRKQNSELLPLVIWPTIIFVPAILFTTLLIGYSDNELFNYEVGYKTVDGPYFWVFLVFFSVYWLWSLVNLLSAWRRSDGMHKANIKLVTIGIIGSLLVSVIFDIILPLNTITKFGFVGSLATSIWLGVTSYILVKK